MVSLRVQSTSGALTSRGFPKPQKIVSTLPRFGILGRYPSKPSCPPMTVLVSPSIDSAVFHGPSIDRGALDPYQPLSLTQPRSLTVPSPAPSISVPLAESMHAAYGQLMADSSGTECVILFGPQEIESRLETDYYSCWVAVFLSRTHRARS